MRFPVLPAGGLLLFVLAAFPAPANAGFLSSISGWFGSSKPIAAETNSNSQTMPLLQAAINLNPNPARGGGDITVVDGTSLLPESGPSGTAADIDEWPSSGEIALYVVRPGDTLSGIASMYGVSSNTILWANDLKKGSALTVGQTLVILPISGVRHTVLKGETIAGIAKQFNGDKEEIIAYNDLPADGSLTVGASIVIPNGEIAAPVSSAKLTSKSGTRSTSKVPPEPAHDTNGPSYPGYYARPIATYTETQGLHGYNAVDLAGPYGESIQAAAAGVVIVAKSSGWNGGYGQYVVIAHNNGTQTLYAHMSAVLVHAGQEVSQSQVIGKEGQTGLATGPHLHFEVRGATNPF